MKKIMILTISLIYLNGCVSIEFKKGTHHIEPIKYNYDKQTQEIIIKTSDNKIIYSELFQRMCGGYGLVGIVAPIIPTWDNLECKNFKVKVRPADQVLISYHNKIYKPILFDPQYHTYTFPIPTKSLSDGAILIIEKDGEKFEIPFKYQHTFEFQLWGK